MRVFQDNPRLLTNNAPQKRHIRVQYLTSNGPKSRDAMWVMEAMLTDLAGALGRDRAPNEKTAFMAALADAKDFLLLSAYVDIFVFQAFGARVEREVDGVNAWIKHVSDLLKRCIEAIATLKQPPKESEAKNAITALKKLLDDTASGLRSDLGGFGTADPDMAWQIERLSTTLQQKAAASMTDKNRMEVLQEGLKAIPLRIKDLLSEFDNRSGKELDAARRSVGYHNNAYRAIFLTWAEAKEAIAKLDTNIRTDIDTTIAGWTKLGVDKQVVGVPRLGLVELLLRVVAYDWPVITGEKVQERLRTLKLYKYAIQVWKDYAEHATLAPSCIFICAGKKSPGNGQLTGPLVITTSTDHFEWCQDVNVFFKDEHDYRWTPGFNVVQKSTDAKKSYFAAKQDQANKISLYKARKDEIAQWKTNQDRYCNHSAEYAFPFTSPEFFFKGRCVRCQHLFEYAVENNILTLEDKLLDSSQDERFSMGWLCAETHAHFYCLEAHH